jgi:hypothetical protein
MLLSGAYAISAWITLRTSGWAPAHRGTPCGAEWPRRQLLRKAVRPVPKRQLIPHLQRCEKAFWQFGATNTITDAAELARRKNAGKTALEVPPATVRRESNFAQPNRDLSRSVTLQHCRVPCVIALKCGRTVIAQSDTVCAND